jgi:membrane-associated phospholipid phosphatase
MRPVPPSLAAAPDPAARRTLRARLTAGPVLRTIGLVDLRIFRLLRTHGHGRRTERAIAAFSRTGEHAIGWIAIGVGGAALDPPRRERWLRGLLAVTGAYVLNTILKQIARRPRPTLEDLPALIGTPTQLSFPSAHACSSFAAARAYTGLLPGGPLTAVAAGMAVSRVYLGVHYPSDVVVGAAIGRLVGGIAR